MGKLTKEEIRKKHIEKRKNMSFIEKEEKDNEIFEKLVGLDLFLNSLVVLSYVSVKLEVDTINIIKYCFEKDKKVFVPVCCEDRKDMNFYLIDSLTELGVTKYFLLEPKPNENKIFQNLLLKNTICIVPAICFNFFGDRVGYGGGYYDRFLKNFEGLKIGICYDFNLEKDFLKSSLDVPVDLVLTEKRILNFKNI